MEHASGAWNLGPASDCLFITSRWYLLNPAFVFYVYTYTETSYWFCLSGEPWLTHLPTMG